MPLHTSVVGVATLVMCTAGLEWRRPRAYSFKNETDSTNQSLPISHSLASACLRFFPIFFAHASVADSPLCDHMSCLQRARAEIN